MALRNRHIEGVVAWIGLQLSLGFVRDARGEEAAYCCEYLGR